MKYTGILQAFRFQLGLWQAKRKNELEKNELEANVRLTHAVPNRTERREEKEKVNKEL